MIYVLTQSECYYPCSGCDDWLGVFTDPEAASKAYADALRGLRDGELLSLIEIDGTSFAEVARR